MTFLSRAALLTWAGATAALAGAPELPASRSEPVVEALHGVNVSDPFRWLEDEAAPAVKAWVKAEDDFARQALEHLPARQRLAQRFAELYYVESVTPPQKRGGRLFFTKQLPDKEKAILVMREGAGPDKVVLDPNAWSTDGSVSLGAWVPSWDGKWIAFAHKANNSDEAVLRLCNVDTGEWTPLKIEGAKYAHPQWAKDNSGFYYEWVPPVSEQVKVAERPGFTEIRWHPLSGDPAKDPVVHEKLGDPTIFLRCQLSYDGKYLIAYRMRGWGENDLSIKELGKDRGFVPVVEGFKAKYSADVHQGQLYIATDEGAPRGRVFRAPADKPQRKQWKLIVPEDRSATLEGASIVGGQLSLSYLDKAHSELRFARLDGGGVRRLPLPGLGVATEVVGLPDDDEAFYSYSSLTMAKEVFRLSVKSLKAEQWSKTQTPIDPKPFVVNQVTFPSKDGTPVSMFIVRRKDVGNDGSAPALLYGYGGFNLSMLPAFNASIYPWLEAGGIYALAQLRGGGEYGQKWHDSGRLAKKQNVFDDFAAAAQYLIARRYTKPERLAIMGGSNGGLLVGAAATQHPELYGAVVCRVPLLDMVRYTRFGSGKTWVHEYGDPDVEADFKVLYAYSPYHRLSSAAKYPPLLMLSADHDDRVDPMHARKFVAALQSMGQQALLRVEVNAGHGGADVLKKTVELNSDMYAWLFGAMGMDPPAPSTSQQTGAPGSK